MYYKKGGGNHLQLYDKDNGQYLDEEKVKMCERDREALFMLLYFGVDYKNIIVHFPVNGIHDEDYARLFVKYIRADCKPLFMEEKKATHLLTYQPGHDKSAFLKKIGYRNEEIESLMVDVDVDTDFTSLIFSKYKNEWVLCKAKTVLKGKIVTSIWQLHPDLTLHFVTLIPGGDKEWK